MTTRKLFPKFFESKKPSQGETPIVNKENFKDNEFEEFNSTYKTQKLHRSRSGRLKESSRIRLAIAKDTFEAPGPQSAPVTSMTKAATGLATGLAGRELPMCESKRISRSLHSHINSSSPDDAPPAPPARHSSGEGDYRYGFDENEIF